MRSTVKGKKKYPSRYKKLTELFPSLVKFQKELDKVYKFSKKIPSTTRIDKVSSSGSDIPVPNNIDDAKLNLLCTDPKEIKYTWDVLMKYQQDEINEKEPEKEVKIEEPLICKEMKQGITELHDLIIDGTESVANIKHAAMRKESKRAEKEKEYRENLNILFDQASKKAKEEFETINSGWETLKKLYNPLDIHKGTNFLKEKCDGLLRGKDDMIEYLKSELVKKDEGFAVELDKQGKEIDILVDRIEEQISVLKDAYQMQLDKLEGMIDNEKEEIIINNRNIWEALIKERDDIDRGAVEKIYKLLEEHEMKTDMDNIEQNERKRALDIDLNNIIHKMTIELDRLRSMCTLNMEKISYNYQLLLKRQSENQLIKSQNKRRILQLRCDMEAMKNKIKKGTIELAKEISDNISAIKNLQENIKEFDERFSFLAGANSKKYFDLWNFNQKRAEDLLKEIFAGDKVLFEQVLFLPWTAPTEVKFLKEAMPSYREGLRVCATLKKRRVQKPKFELSEDEKVDDNTLNLIRLVLKNTPKVCTFVLDQHLRQYGKFYSPGERLLLELDGIFNALNISSNRDMQLLVKYFGRYVTCPDCQNNYLTGYMVDKTVQTGEETLPKPLEDHATEKSKECVEESENSESGKTCVLEDLVKYHLKVIADNVFQEVNHSPCEGANFAECEPKVNDETVDDTEITEADIVEKHKLFGMKSNEYPIKWFVSNLTKVCFDDPLQELEKKHEAITIVKDPKEVVRVCNNPQHHPYINPIDIVKAIKEFATDFFTINKAKKNKTLEELTSTMRITPSRCLEEKEIKEFWQGILDTIPKEKIDLWDTMYLAMQDYLKALQKRHDLNMEIQRLQRSNYDLRRLLQRYVDESKTELGEHLPFFKDLFEHEISFDSD